MIKVRNEAFQYFFFFMQERMNIFWKKYYQEPFPWTQSLVLREYKFTNVYRACDRVSQYLLQKVIYDNNQSSLKEEDILLRILIFKVFNKIETWKYIESKIGRLERKTFNADQLSKILDERIKETPIFNGAYIMTGSQSNYNRYNSKHKRWLKMVEKEILKPGLLSKIIQSTSLEEIYKHLISCSFIGNFLAYQYSIDFNYSEVINYDENSFVKAGIGAIRGIHKCFENIGKYSYEDIIKYTSENVEVYQEKYGFNNFKSLFGRMPTLIDYQNCFCETDKLLRVELPQLNLNNKRIKQKYKKTERPIIYLFPPKWNLNHKL